MILVLIHIPLLFHCFCKGFQSIKKFLHKEMIKYGYFPKFKMVHKNKITISKNQSKLNAPPKIKKYKNIKLSSSSRANINQPKELLEQINDNNNNKNVINIKDKKNKKAKGCKSKNGKKNQNNHILINNVILLDKLKNKKNNKKSKRKIRKKIHNIPTQAKEVGKNEKIDEKEKNIFNLNLININLNDKKIKEYIPKNSLQILNNYTFKEAIKYDMRSICAIFYIFLLSKQAVFHTFLFKSPLEPFSIRLCLLLFITSSDLALNAFFYLDDKISKKYRYAQSLFLFTFNNNITIILLSTFIGFIFLTLFTNLSNSTNKIREVFRSEEEKMKKSKKYFLSEESKKGIYIEIENILKRHKAKVIILVVIEFSLILFFWYYVTAFCHVYSSTQISWLFDSFLSMLSRLIIELLLSLLFAKLYRMAVEANTLCLYKIVLFFYSFG